MAVVTDRYGGRWTVERGDPAWEYISKALRRELPLDYQIVPVQVLLGGAVPNYDGGEGLTADGAARYYETLAAMVVV